MSGLFWNWFVIIQHHDYLNGSFCCAVCLLAPSLCLWLLQRNMSFFIINSWHIGFLRLSFFSDSDIVFASEYQFSLRYIKSQTKMIIRTPHYVELYFQSARNYWVFFLGVSGICVHWFHNKQPCLPYTGKAMNKLSLDWVL